MFICDVQIPVGGIWSTVLIWPVSVYASDRLLTESTDHPLIGYRRSAGRVGESARSFSSIVCSDPDWQHDSMDPALSAQHGLRRILQIVANKQPMRPT